MKGRGIMIDDENDLIISVKRGADGLITQGLFIGDTTHQNQEQIIVAHTGTIKHSPLVGVGVTDYLDDEVPDSLFRTIRTQLSADGQKVNSVGFNSRGELEIDAKYN